jgi:hypothetical protein
MSDPLFWENQSYREDVNKSRTIAGIVSCAVGNQIPFRVFRAPAGRFVKKLNEYLEHADECRRMARVALPQHRTPLEQMALTWEQLAEVRRRQLAKQSKEPDGADEANTPASEAIRFR